RRRSTTRRAGAAGNGLLRAPPVSARPSPPGAHRPNSSGLAYRTGWPGRVLVKADYAQIELYVAAELSGDERMLRALNAGEDLHRLTAAALYGKPPGDRPPAGRGFGNNMNCASVFGQGVRGLIAQSTAQGIALGGAEARGFLARFA